MTDPGVVGAGGAGGAAAPDAALESCLQLLRGLGARPGYGFSDSEVLANLRAVHALIAVAESVRLGLVEELRTRPGAVPRSGPAGGAKRFLAEALRVGGDQAAKDLDAAQALHSAAPTLPALGAALAGGEVSRAHVDVAVRAFGKLPKKLKVKTITDDTGRQVPGSWYIDQIITREARRYAPTDVTSLCRKIRHRLDPDHADRFDADADERRTCTITTDFTGMTVINAALDPASGLQVRGAIARRAALRPAGTAIGADGATVTVPDARSQRQRQADALVDLVLAGSRVLDVPAGGKDHDNTSDDTDGTDPGAEGGERSPGSGWQAAGGVDVTLVVTLPQVMAGYLPQDAEHATEIAAAGLARTTLAGPGGTYPGATVDPRIVARLVCDSPIRRILVGPHGAVLHHGRSRRLASTAQKRALAVRDGGCIVPGCHAPPEWSDAHHLVPWEHGGTTDIDQMVLLCRRHHTAHHAGVYPIQMRDGVPWVRMPAWYDPARPWLRNAVHHHHDLANDIARTLLDDPEAA